MPDTLPKYLRKWRRPRSYFGTEWPEYYVFLGRHRDSCSVDRSNFTVALDELGGESETVVINRCSHWGFGWVENIMIHENDGAALEKADTMMARLEGYSLLDEEHYSDLASTEMADYWDGITPDMRVSWAKDERDKCHWLRFEPIAGYGEMSFEQLVGDGAELARRILESLRED